VGGAVYFIKNDPAALQSALYKTSATQLVPLITGQPWNAAPYQQQQPVVHKNKIYFVRDNQIWESDGTGAGTVLYFKPPPNSNAPNYEWRAGEMVSNGDSLYFILYNQNLTGPYTTGDLWSISGNPGDPGTPLLKTVYQAINGGGGFGGRLTVLSQVNGHAILKAETVAGAGGNHFSGPVTLYSPGFAQFSTGSQTVNNGGFVYTSAIIDNRFYVLSKEEIFSFYDPPVFKNELWVTQSFGPKLLLKKFASRPDGVGKHFGVLGNRVFFAADDSTGLGQELWYSDGTPGGTVLVKDIHPGAGDAKIGAFASDGLHVYFPAFDGNTWALWRSDGTPGGTTKVANFPTTSIETPIKNLFFNQKTLYFSGNDGTTGDEPWAMEIPSNPADRPDLELSIRHRLSHLLIPGIIDLEVKVKNRGTGPATGVKVKFAPPVGFTFPVDLVNRQLEIDLGTIKSGDSVVQVLSYLTRIPATATSREYFLFAQISAQNEPDTDSSPNSVPCNSGICTPVEDDEARIYAPDSAPCDLAVSLVSAHCDPGKLPEISDNTYDYTINVTGSTPGLGFGWFRSLYGGGERLQDEAIALHYTIPDMASANFLAFFDNNNPRCPLVNLSLEYLSLPCQFVPTTEAASAIGFSLSPNPATRSVSLQWLDTDIREARGSIVNPLGQTVKTFPLTGAQGIPTTIDLSGLGSGLYWVRVEVPGRGSGVKRLVVAE
jgi:ELWxxDGT repeat protein